MGSDATNPRFIIRERRFWMRMDTHAVVSDREPDFQRICHDPEGTIFRVFKVGLADPPPNQSCPRAYVGSLRFGPSLPRPEELRRFYRRAASLAHLVKLPPDSFVRRIKAFLKRELQKP